MNMNSNMNTLGVKRGIDIPVSATVTAVDLKRGVCKCVATNGTPIRDVTWASRQSGIGASSDNYIPQEFDSVLLMRNPVTGRWEILRGADVRYRKVVENQHIANQTVLTPDIADYTIMKFDNVLVNPGTPEDTRVGDKIQTSESGALLGIRRAGTIIAKATALCQLILSPFGDLVRLISRNFEHFTDVDSEYKVNSRNKLFTLREVFRSTPDSRNIRASMVEVSGDVQMGEAIGKEYATMTADQHSQAVSGAVAEDVLVVKRTRIFDEDNTNTSIESDRIDGSEERLIQDAGAKNTNHTLQTNALDRQEIDNVNTNQHYSRVVDASKQHEIYDDAGGTHKAEAHTEGARHWLRIHHGDGSYYEQTESVIHLDVASATKVDIDKDKLVINASGGSVVTISSNGTITLKANSSVLVDTPSTTFTGNITVNGFSQLTGGANVG